MQEAQDKDVLGTPKAEIIHYQQTTSQGMIKKLFKQRKIIPDRNNV